MRHGGGASAFRPILVYRRTAGRLLDVKLTHPLGSTLFSVYHTVPLFCFASPPMANEIDRVESWIGAEKGADRGPG